MIHVTYRLTAKNEDHLRNPTLGNRVWATFFTIHRVYRVQARTMQLAASLLLHCVNMAAVWQACQ